MAGIVGTAPILAGVDGSESSIAVLWAADEAVRRRAPLRLVFANGGATMTDTGGIAPPQSFYDAIDRGVAVCAN
jgi:hypothetical protein